jgi:8-oxo-dGTP pyrophosphatase MutT (NUDIX family)
MNEQHNPWTILNETNVYDNNWINVTEFKVINPSGGKGIYGKIHFKNHAIGIVPLDKEMNTWLVGQFRFPIDQYSWEIPEGGCAEEEDQLDAAKRELEEETGLKALRWTKILDLHLSNSVSDEGGTIYLAQDLSEHSAMPDETEQLAIRKLPFEVAYKMVKDGKITDSVSVSAILQVKLMMLEGLI